MRYYLVVIVCLQSSMLSSVFPELNSVNATLPAPLDLNTASQVSTPTDTNTETASTDLTNAHITTESQFTSDDNFGITKPKENNSFTSSTIMATEDGEDTNQSTILVHEDQSQTAHPEASTISLGEEIEAKSEVSEIVVHTIQSSGTTDTTWTEKLSSAEGVTRNIPTYMTNSDEPKDTTVSSVVAETDRVVANTTLSVDLDFNGISRVSEETTLSIDDVVNNIRLLCKNVNDCPPQVLCVSISNSCECMVEREANERNLTRCDRESSSNYSQNTTENDVRELKIPHTYRKFINLSSSDQSISVSTVAFSPSVEIVEWFQRYDGKFKTFLASKLSLSWDKLNNWTVKFPNEPNNILYVAPSPFHNEDVIMVSFLVQNPFDDSSDAYLHAEDVLDCIRKEWSDFESQMQLKVAYMKIGFPPETLKPCSKKVLGSLNEIEVKVLFLGLLAVSACALIAAIVAIAMHCRARRSRFIDLSAIQRLPYRHPGAVLIRSPGDGVINGHDLATDQQCQEEEQHRHNWTASRSQAEKEDHIESPTDKTLMVDIKGPKKEINDETPF